MSGPVREFKREVCPVCGHKSWCGRREDGLVLCKRPPTPREVIGFVFKGMAEDRVTGMYVEAGREFDNGQPKRPDARPRPTTNSPSDQKKISSESLETKYPELAAHLTPQRRQALADELNLPVSGLDCLSIGWWPDRRWWNPDTQSHEGEPGCWTFPEQDALGRIIGLGLRWPAGHKGQMAGGHRGLTLPNGWRGLPDPVIVVEGPSDVLAGRALSLNVIGRPSNCGGADLIAQACRDRRVIIIGENDRKPDGLWPGKEGAYAVAHKLEAAWDRPVPVAFPPDRTKDLREWVINLAPDLANADVAVLSKAILSVLLPAALVWLVGPRDKRGRVVVKVFRWADGAEAPPIHSDRLHRDQHSARRRFAKALVKVETQADLDQVTRQMISLKVPSDERSEAGHVDPTHRQSSANVGVSQDSNGNELPTVFLPGGPVSIQASASKLGQLLGKTKRYFLRGGAVVTIALDDAGHPILETIKPASLASVFETVATLREFSKQHGQFVAQPVACSEQQAKLVQHCEAFQQVLPPLRLLSSCPVLIERGGELVQIRGYDRESGIMALAEPAREIPLADAVAMLLEMLIDFRFATEGDSARAVAAVTTPALVMGGLLGGRAPVDLGEADSSQSGKGYRNKLTAAVYNHAVRAVTQKKGGVGSLEESFATALIRGRNFISLDNMRGRIDSPAIESFLTEDSFLARSPHQAAVDIDPRQVILQLTSNKADITIDLANRASCIRIFKQPAGYPFREYPEGDILDHVRANQPWYLGAVFAVVRAWHQAGKPRTNETRHDFRPWARTLDWIVRNIFDAGHLLEGHRETQVRMTTPALNWLRDVALAVRDARQMGLWLRAAQLADILTESSTVELPGLADGDDPEDEENRKRILQAMGRRLGQCFREGNTRSIDGLEIERREWNDPQYRRPIREYSFRAVEIGPTECACPPEAHRGRIGANQAEETLKPPVEGEESAGPITAAPVCAYGAPKAAPIRAPIERAVAPNAPMDHVIPMRDDQKKRALENRCFTNYEYRKKDGTNRRIGALDADSPPPPYADSPSPGLVGPPHPLPPPHSSRSVSKARWLSEERDHLPPEVVELAAQRDGWTPGGWRDRLLQLAERCQDLHPDRSDTLRQAAEVMIRSPRSSEK